VTAAPWTPDREIELVAGTPPGGGQDRPARALIDVLAAHKLVDVPIRLTNIPGRGGGNAWDYLRGKAGDPHVLAINSPTIISNKLLGVSTFDYAALTPLCSLYTEAPAFLVRADSPLAAFGDLVGRLAADAAAVPISLATAIGNTNHIALSIVTRHAGSDPRQLQIAVFDSARDAIAHVIGGKAELAVVTAVSAVPELESKQLRVLAVSSPQRLDRLFAHAPTLLESAIACDIGMWRGVIAPAALPPPALTFWQRVLAVATASAEWKAELAKKYWTDTYTAGAALQAFLDRERELTSTALRDLGLLPA
jgi:putative tricarboxylic transport membrane protein